MAILLDVLAANQKYVDEDHEKESQRERCRYPYCEIHCSTFFRTVYALPNRLRHRGSFPANSLAAPPGR